MRALARMDLLCEGLKRGCRARPNLHFEQPARIPSMLKRDICPKETAQKPLQLGLHARKGLRRIRRQQPIVDPQIRLIRTELDPAQLRVPVEQCRGLEGSAEAEAQP